MKTDGGSKCLQQYMLHQYSLYIFLEALCAYLHTSAGKTGIYATITKKWNIVEHIVKMHHHG